MDTLQKMGKLQQEKEEVIGRLLVQEEVNQIFINEPMRIEDCKPEFMSELWSLIIESKPVEETGSKPKIESVPFIPSRI